MHRSTRWPMARSRKTGIRYLACQRNRIPFIKFITFSLISCELRRQGAVTSTSRCILPRSQVALTLSALLAELRRPSSAVVTVPWSAAEANAGFGRLQASLSTLLGALARTPATADRREPQHAELGLKSNHTVAGSNARGGKQTDDTLTNLRRAKSTSTPRLPDRVGSRP